MMAVAGLLAVVAGPAQAQLVTRAASDAGLATSEPGVNLTRSSAGYTYFNRAGASQSQHDEALNICLADAKRMQQPDDNGAAAAGAAGGLLGALVVGMVQGAVNGMQERRGVAANVENCMVVDGWRVVRLDETEGKTLDALEQPGLHEALTDRIGAAEPVGQIVRVYDNDAIHGDTVVIGRAGDLDKVSLSLQALPPQTEAPPAARKGPEAPRSARPPRALKPEDVAPTTDDALITVRLVGMAEEGGRVLMFTRAGPAPGVQPWEVDGKPALFAAALPTRGAARGDRTRATNQTFSVPPGRWRLSAMMSGQHITHFCLGSSGFEAKAGEAVYAGAFDLSGENLGPDLAMRDDLFAADSPAAKAGVTHQTATWSYGDKELCQGAYLYALNLAPVVAPVGEAVEPVETSVVVEDVVPEAAEAVTAK